MNGRLMVKVYLSLLPIIFICSCGASVPVKKEPKKVSASAEQDFRAAEKLAKSGNSKKAVPLLKHFAQANPESEFTGEALYLMGLAHMNAQALPEALVDFNSVINLPIASPYEIDATLKAARIQIKLGQIKDAEKTIERSASWKNLSPDRAVETEKLRLDIALNLKRPLRALESMVQLGQITSTGPQGLSQNEREKFKTQALEFVDSKFSEEELREIADNDRFGFVRPTAMYRYGLLLAEKKQYTLSQHYFARTIELAPGSELADRAKTLINQISSRDHVEPHTIGVVLPLTGKQAGIGYKALRGIQLGLGIYGNNGKSSGFRLAIVDSEGNPDMARRAIERLVQEDSVISIIGGLLSKTAGAEASKAQELGVPTIMLSQKSGITQAGDFIFRNALTSQMQISYLVETAMTQLGMKNFALLFPNDAYGVEYANLFWDEVKSRGGEIRAAQPYDPAETDFRGYIQRLVGTFYLEDRGEEYRLFAKSWAEKNPKRSGQRGAPAPEELLPPVIDFDGLFVPDSAKAVGQIAPMLAYSNVANVRLLGPNLWNSSSLITRGQKFVEGSVFVDSFLSTDPTYTGSTFFTGFRAVFDEDPGLTEVQAYDSALILRQLIAGGESTRNGLQARMAKVENFSGAIGKLSVTQSREFRRPLSSLTVSEGKIKGLEPVQR